MGLGQGTRRRASAAGGGRLGTGLLVLGVLLALVGLGTLLYVPWREQQHLAQRPAGPREALPGAWEAVADGADAGVLPVVAQPQDERAVWIDVPRIGVDAPVVEMDLVGGEYQVPSFDVGHHADSADPGQPGNSIYNGHLHTIDAGQVFGRLHELRRGDVVHVYSASYRFDWVVEQAFTVTNREHDFLRPTAEPRLTLYTCAGSYDLRTRDYTHRRVVTGRLAQVVPRAPAAGSPS